jgi:hypothetical protein
MERCLLGAGLIASSPVQRARRREHISRNARGLRDPAKVNSAINIHRVGGSRIQLTDRVVGDGREVDDRIHTDQLIGTHVADVCSALLIAS